MDQQAAGWTVDVHLLTNALLSAAQSRRRIECVERQTVLERNFDLSCSLTLTQENIGSAARKTPTANGML